MYHLRPGVPSQQIDPEDVAMRRALVVRPAGMDPGVTAVEDAVVPGEPVRIRVRLAELRDLQSLTRPGVVLDQSCSPIVPGDHPDRVPVVRDAVRPRHVVRDEELRLPRFRIHAQDPPQPQRGDPELAVDIFHAVTATAVVAGSERNLTMA